MQWLRRAMLGLALISQALVAQVVGETPAAPASGEAGRLMRQKAAAMDAEAEQKLAQEKFECYARTFPNSCLDAAKERHKAAVKQARQLKLEGTTIEREARNRERAVNEAQREADAPRLEAERLAREEKFREEHARKTAEREAKKTEDALELEKRRAKAQADAAARIKKNEEQVRKDGEQAQKAPAARTEREERRRKQAERAAKIDARTKDYAEELKRREVAETQKRAAEEAKKNAGDTGSLRCLISGGCATNPK